MTEREVSPEMIEAYMRFCANRAPDHNEIGLLYFDAAWQASRQQALEEAFSLVGELHATQSAPLSTRYLYDSAISAAQDAIRSLTSPIGDKA